MLILGDIGNTDTKLCLVSTKHKIIKKIIFPSKNLNQKKLSKYFSLIEPNYQTTNLSELTNKPINKINFENELKEIFVKNLSRMYKINNKVNKK